MSAPKLKDKNIESFAEEGRSPMNTSRENDSVVIPMMDKVRGKTVGEVAPKFRVSNHWLNSILKSAKVQEARGRRSRKQKKLKKKRSTRRK